MLGKLKSKKLIKASFILLLSIFVYFVYWFFDLHRTIEDRIAKNWFLPPIEYYSAPEHFTAGMKYSPSQLKTLFKLNRFQEKAPDKRIQEKTFSLWQEDQCLENLSEAHDEISHCVIFNKNDLSNPQDWGLIAFNSDNVVTYVFSGQPLLPVDRIELDPRVFAQFYDGQPMLRRLITINETPLSCLNAITSIEDKDFLNHQGVSFRAITRALLSMVSHGRVTQGGSTITQQLVKNYFLTSERTLKRKIKEFFMALILESKVSKDLILQNYLNVIYMGQSGPFQVRGYGAAAEYYFNKKLENLELPECALLAAIVNSPGRFNPFKSDSSAALQRRNRVLEKMLENSHIDQQTFNEASQSQLPKSPQRLLTEPAPYFVDAISEKIKDKNFNAENGLKIYTTMVPEAQEAALQAVRKGLDSIEKSHKNIQELSQQGKSLQALLIAAEVSTGEIIALVGGSSFKKTQYNRAISGHRQVGSIMKPLIYLTALENFTDNGERYNPLTIIEDEPFTYKYENQSWSPKNYSNKTFGRLPLFVALKNSINISTAKVGLQVGLNSIVDLSKRMGIESALQPLPSITLGAFELFPFEVLNVYGTIARYGSFIPSQLYTKVDDNKHNLYEYHPQGQQITSAQTAAVLVGMMKQTILSGTGRSIPLRGFKYPAAGKTGTTSDTKDSWFAGFTPHVVCVVWVGYDDNTPHGLTGASGALPIWTEFMKTYATRYGETEFTIPEGTVKLTVPRQKLLEMMDDPEILHTEDDIELVFRTENAP